MTSLRSLALVAAGVALLAGCDSNGSSNSNAAPAVFTLSDAAGPNEVLMFTPGSDGALTAAGTFATQGTGSDGDLGAATDPIVISPDRRYLYAVNRGSDDVTVFEITAGGLQFLERVPAGGAGPVSLAINDGLVYVLNTGRGAAPGNVAAFERLRTGRLRAITTAALPAGVAGPPQIGFSPNGRTAIVTDRPSNVLVAYPVGRDGAPGTPVVNASAGVTPFGFDFDASGRLFVSNANAPSGPVADGSSVTSYRLSGTATSTVQAEAATTETAACWLRTVGSRFYVTNTGSGTISGFDVRSNGTVQILDADGVTATTGANPRDLNVSGSFLYAQSDSGLDGFRIANDGSLTPVGTAALPATARGVATL